MIIRMSSAFKDCQFARLRKVKNNNIISENSPTVIQTPLMLET